MFPAQARFHLLKDTGQEGLFAARYRLSKFSIEIAEHKFRAGEADFPAGSWIISSQDGLLPALRDTAAELGLDFTSAATAPEVPRHAAKTPRVGVWVPWADTDSIGWIRYSLDQRKIPTPISATKTFATARCKTNSTYCFTATLISNSPNKSRACPSAGVPCPSKNFANSQLRHAR